MARVIHRGLTARHPHARYTAGLDARIMVGIVSRLPRHDRDALLARLVGLRRVPVQMAGAHPLADQGS